MLCVRRALLLPEGAAQPLVPRFWLRVLRSADVAALAISPRDAAVLAHLADVRFSLDGSEDGSELHGRREWQGCRGVAGDAGCHVLRKAERGFRGGVGLSVRGQSTC